MSSSSDDEEWDEIEPNSSGKISEKAGIDINNDNEESQGKDMEITIVLAPKKASKKVASKQDRHLQLLYHESMLLALLASCLFRNRLSNDVELEAKLLSLVPFDILVSDFSRERKKTKTSKYSRQLCALVKWFHGEAKFTHHFIAYDTLRALSKPDLLNGLSRECACIYFLALLRSFGYDARLIASLHTFPRIISQSMKRLNETIYPIDFFVDVLIDEEWITIDVLSGKLGDVSIKDPLYVIAVANIPMPPFVTIKDITRKFTDQWSILVKKRSENWWNQTLWLFSPDRDAMGPQELKENKKLIEMEATEKMPTSLGGFKNHPLFVLERHLNQNEDIYPKDKENSVGVFKNELVFPRKLVRILHTLEKWKRLGRAIPSGTIPYKIILTKKKEEKHLFGQWQTIDWVRPILQDGKIPTNEFGNIEIFHEHMIPLECVHIRGEIAKKVAQKLDIEFARACVDFEHKKRRSFPVFDGIIVHQHSEEIITMAIQERIKGETEASKAKKETEILHRWKRIITGALLYERLKKDYAQ